MVVGLGAVGFGAGLEAGDALLAREVLGLGDLARGLALGELLGASFFTGGLRVEGGLALVLVRGLAAGLFSVTVDLGIGLDNGLALVGLEVVGLEVGAVGLEGFFTSPGFDVGGLDFAGGTLFDVVVGLVLLLGPPGLVLDLSTFTSDFALSVA